MWSWGRGELQPVNEPWGPWMGYEACALEGSGGRRGCLSPPGSVLTSVEAEPPRALQGEEPA